MDSKRADTAFVERLIKEFRAFHANWKDEYQNLPPQNTKAYDKAYFEGIARNRQADGGEAEQPS
jgi:hypothetical protein